MGNKYTKWRSFGFGSAPRSFWYSLAFVGVFLVIYLLMAFTKYASEANPVITDLAMTLAPLASLVIAWTGVKRSLMQQNLAPEALSLQRRLRFWLPLVFSTALLFQTLGNAYHTYYDVTIVEGVPILTFFLILWTYPAMLAGVLLLPRDILAGKLPLRFMMDSLMLIMALVTFSWYFLLGPALLQSLSSASPIGGFTLAYSAFDLLIICCLIVLSRSIADQVLRNGLRMLSFALVIFVLTDCLTTTQSLQGPPDSTWLCLGWIVGNFALGLSLQAMRQHSATDVTTSTITPQAASLVASPIWRSLLSYALVPVMIGLVFSVWTTDKIGILAIGTYTCSALLVIVIFIKQLVSIHEVHRLNQDFQRLQHIVEEKNIALGQANGRLEALATTDPLTELPNHRALVATLEQELARANQYERSCSLLFFDIDHFKALNDSYGHGEGDIALREFGSLLRATLPLINTIGRWGGEEFIAILPEQNAAEAVIIAEELRNAVSKQSFTVGGGMHLTCSIGVASFPTHAVKQEALLEAADSAMYGSKRLGRDQVRVIDDPAVVALLASNANTEGRDDIALAGMVRALVVLVEKRDVVTGKHAHYAGELILAMAQSLRLPEGVAQLLSRAGELHDIGNIIIPDNILQKREPLTEQELDLIHQHPKVGAEVVSSIPSLRGLAPIIQSHHEWWNGMGYPDHLAGDAIPFGARLLAVVDAYVAMIHAQPNQDAYKPDEAFAELQRAAGTQFDPVIVEQFLSLQAATAVAPRKEVGVV
jgi:two-component system cell cycle response regulator